jgi:spermidine synthase
MSANFEELDYARTPLGELILRRRRVLSTGQDIYEVKLDDSFLMSSLVNDSEIALADRCLVGIESSALDVAVGGLGLGYTAQAALAHSSVRSVVVIEYLAEVIGWHTRKLVPAADSLVDDERCRFVNGDFFALVQNAELGLDLTSPGRKFDAILVDIDHTPDYFLDPSHEVFYSKGGLRTLSEQVKEGGVFGLWSAGEPDETVIQTIATAFHNAEASVVEFRNPLLNIDDRNTIYVGIGPIR